MFNKKVLTLVILSLVVTALLSACGAQAPKENKVKDITWKWSSLSETLPASISVVPNPENYTLLLGSDGSLSIKADCNMVGGSYSLDGSALSITLGASTLVYCGDESLDQLYLTSLGQVESFSIVNGELVLKMADDAGTMQFVK